jgi:hypothetical protein
MQPLRSGAPGGGLTRASVLPRTGITFAGVHDSYWTHAGRCGRELIRHAFVSRPRLLCPPCLTPPRPVYCASRSVDEMSSILRDTVRQQLLRCVLTPFFLLCDTTSPSLPPSVCPVC